MRLIICLFLIISFSLESKNPVKERARLSSVQIIDRNGFSENITIKEKLEGFENVNFLSSQPYKRVLRVYQPDREGSIRSFLTTYFENGQVKQYLEIKNARAYGLYQEWYANGQVKVKTHVIGGPPDLSPLAESQWVFEGLSLAYDEEGHQIAKISYKKGALEGIAETYSSTGVVLSKTPYKNGVIEGSELLYSPSGVLLEKHQYKGGVLDGPSETYWDAEKIATVEAYKNGMLAHGVSFSKEGSIVHFVNEGEGSRLYVVLAHLKQEQEIHDGEIRGKVIALDESGRTTSIFHVRHGEKHGLETLYYLNGKEKIAMEWIEGNIQGQVTTWYPNGIKESEREVIKNKKQGLALAWYPTGDLLLIESYNNDLLDKGEYFKKGERSPISSIKQGNGLATLFDKDGLLRQKVTYESGKPIIQ